MEFAITVIGSWDGFGEATEVTSPIASSLAEPSFLDHPLAVDLHLMTLNMADLLMWLAVVALFCGGLARYACDDGYGGGEGYKLHLRLQ